ncbi:hypothetical protein DPMN_148528 [Dreissena polymorpha]|uniref:Uncharacterized protein n=1 Tax=Dreissena polymorpha TaxID=45954 RepID=A0A9D4FE74_DREPO|nr:hypothetical protein DPMN_148528 [Dreissena polymorpha]
MQTNCLLPDRLLWGDKDHHMQARKQVHVPDNEETTRLVNISIHVMHSKIQHVKIVHKTCSVPICETNLQHHYHLR